MQGPDGVTLSNEVEVTGQQSVGLRVAVRRGDVLERLELCQLGNRNSLDRRDASLDALHPILVEAVPVLEVVTGADAELGSATFDLVGSRRGQCAHVGVTVDHAHVEALCRWHGEYARVGHTGAHEGTVDGDLVERVRHLGEVQRVAEPRLLAVNGLATLLEQVVVRVEVLPTFGALGRLNGVGIRECALAGQGVLLCNCGRECFRVRIACRT